MHLFLKVNCFRVLFYLTYIKKFRLPRRSNGELLEVRKYALHIFYGYLLNINGVSRSVHPSLCHSIIHYEAFTFNCEESKIRREDGLVIPTDLPYKNSETSKFSDFVQN